MSSTTANKIKNTRGSKVTDYHLELANIFHGNVINAKSPTIQIDINSKESRDFCRKQELINQAKAKSNRLPEIYRAQEAKERQLKQDVQDYLVLAAPQLKDKELEIQVHTYPVACVRFRVV